MFQRMYQSSKLKQNYIESRFILQSSQDKHADAHLQGIKTLSLDYFNQSLYTLHMLATKIDIQNFDYVSLQEFKLIAEILTAFLCNKNRSQVN